MNLLNKIDGFIDKVDERKDVADFMKEASQWLKGKRKVGGADYDKFYKEMLKTWKIKSYKDLPKPKQDEFFDAVFKAWDKKGKKEGVK